MPPPPRPVRVSDHPAARCRRWDAVLVGHEFQCTVPANWTAPRSAAGAPGDDLPVDVPAGTDETLANLVSREARKELLPILKQPIDAADFLTSRALRSMGDTR
ncbi:hypothetical protein GCM10010207_43870 [Streptomyces atratus]|nr:hypothetical protein GCM10010207_43870 [Streptomyces atratus]